MQGPGWGPKANEAMVSSILLPSDLSFDRGWRRGLRGGGRKAGWKLASSGKVKSETEQVGWAFNQDCEGCVDLT